MSDEIPLRVILVQPPAGVDYGIQQGQGSGYQTILTQRGTGKDLTFEFSILVKPAESDAELDFKGPIVQGKRGERFIYVDIGQSAGQVGTCWNRRLKIPLVGITLADIKALPGNASPRLEATVPGTAKDGGPNCATVKPFAGWSVR